MFEVSKYWGHGRRGDLDIDIEPSPSQPATVASGVQAPAPKIDVRTGKPAPRPPRPGERIEKEIRKQARESRPALHHK